MLGDHDVVALRRDRGMNRAARALKNLLVLDGILDAAEQQIARADFRQALTKADLHVKHAQPVIPGLFEHFGGASDQVGLVLRINRNDGGLQVQAKNRRAGSIKVGQGNPPRSCLSDAPGLAMSPALALCVVE
jgi:hypothetical protein